MDGHDLLKTSYEPTKVMSTYLLAFAVCDFGFRETELADNTLVIRDANQNGDFSFKHEVVHFIYMWHSLMYNLYKAAAAQCYAEMPHHALIQTLIHLGVKCSVGAVKWFSELVCLGCLSLEGPRLMCIYYEVHQKFPCFWIKCSSVIILPPIGLSDTPSGS